MSQTSKAIAEKFIRALGRGDAETVKSLITDDIVAVCTGTSAVSGTRGYAEVVGACDIFKQIMKDGIKFDLISTTAEEDRVSMEMRGHSELVNGAAYNNEYHFLFTIRDGRVCRIKEYIDTKLADQVLAPLFAG